MDPQFVIVSSHLGGSKRDGVMRLRASPSLLVIMHLCFRIWSLGDGWMLGVRIKNCCDETQVTISQESVTPLDPSHTFFTQAVTGLLTSHP